MRMLSLAMFLSATEANLIRNQQLYILVVIIILAFEFLQGNRSASVFLELQWNYKYIENIIYDTP